MTIKISANKFADFITAKTDQRRKSIVRQLRRQTTDHAPYYMAFGTPAKEFLKGGLTDQSVILKAIHRMVGRTGTPWKNRDSRITSEAFRSLLSLKPQLDSLGIQFVKPKGIRSAKLQFPELQVTITPDLLVQGERNDKPLIGSMRFYIAKESTYQLGPKGAALVAAMQYQWLAHVATGERAPDSNLCIVIECFQQRVTAAPMDTQHQREILEKGARDLVHLWHEMDHEEAA